MTRSIKMLTIACIALLVLPQYFCYGQQGTITGPGSFSFGPTGVDIEGTKTFTTYIPSTGGNVDDMIQFDALSLFKLGADLNGGIKAAMETGGSVTLSVYSYSPGSPGYGPLIYQVYSETTSSEFIGEPNTVTSSSPLGTIPTNNVKALLQRVVTTTQTPALCTDVIPDLFISSMAYLNKQVPIGLDAPLYSCLKANNYLLTQPVILEVTIKDAHVPKYGLKIPGVEDFDLTNYFDPASALKTVVKVNGQPVRTFIAGVDDDPLNLKLGDLVTYEVTYAGLKKPEIEGVPGVWIARFAGDLMYHCTPSVKPGEFRPWISLDSREHNLQLRKYPEGFQVNVPDWIHNASAGTYTWSWTAQRRMDASKTKYDNHFDWVKYRTLSNGAKQRNNQLEGRNMQFLTYWKNWANTGFTQYDGDAQYIMGFDDDMLIYLNSKYHDANVSGHAPGPGGGIAKLDVILPYGMPEGSDHIYDVKTGYPVQGVPLNIMVTAYKKNREASRSNYDVDTYNGYEIQDLGTDAAHPDGNGAGNNTAPGVVTIKAGGQVVTIKMNVTSPQGQDFGHYGSLEGNIWPAYYEEDMPYTLRGLHQLPISELDKFSMEYEGTDDFGNIEQEVTYLKHLSPSEKAEVLQTGSWTASFTNFRPAYAAITAYYQHDDNTERVIVAGKELKSIYLNNFGEKNLEGNGLAAKIWLNDFRDIPTDEYNIQRSFGSKIRYMKKYVREYTFPVNATTTFNALDGDSHLFWTENTDGFSSSRTLAKRIKDSYLDGTEPGVTEPYIMYYIDGVLQTTGRAGKDFTHQWTEPGTHDLMVQYRRNEDFTLTSYSHKITVVDYVNKFSNDPALGAIVLRDLTADEKIWLGTDDLKWKLAEVKDVYSKYMYIDAPRANAEWNRWADQNDYAAQYTWKHYSGGTAAPSVIAKPDFVQVYLDDHDPTEWMWRNWALRFSSSWLTKYPNGLPEYVNNNQVTRVVDLELDQFAAYIQGNLFTPPTTFPWQHILPLISYTDYQGYRIHKNSNSIYDITSIWSNTTGAFSGSPTLPTDQSLIQSPDISDSQKNHQEFYYDLLGGKKLIVNSEEIADGDLVVYNVAPIVPFNGPFATAGPNTITEGYTVPVGTNTGETFIAHLRLGTCNCHQPDAPEQGGTAARVAATSETGMAYPNPSSGHFMIMMKDGIEGDVRIEMRDVSGKVMFNELQTTQGGHSAIEVNARSYPKGVYILKVQSNTGLHTQKVVIQ